VQSAMRGWVGLAMLLSQSMSIPIVRLLTAQSSARLPTGGLPVCRAERSIGWLSGHFSSGPLSRTSKGSWMCPCSATWLFFRDLVISGVIGGASIALGASIEKGAGRLRTSSVLAIRSTTSVGPGWLSVEGPGALSQRVKIGPDGLPRN
jgi:hypothetical protein